MFRGLLHLHQLKYGSKKVNTYRSKKFAGQYIRDPHKLDIRFLDLISNDKPYLDIIRSIMGPRIQIRSFSIRITHPKSEAGTMWHRDQRSFVSPQPIFHTIPHVFSLSFYLDGATKENGPLYVLPGSHNSVIEGEDEEYYGKHNNQEELFLEKGDVVLFHSSLLHRGGENMSEQNRRLIIIHFTPVYFKKANFENIEPSEEYLSYLNQLREKRDEATLETLGEGGLKGYPLFM